MRQHPPPPRASWRRPALRLLRLPLLCALLLPPAGTAVAASFDCARASTKLTRAICADAELSQLDEQVWNAYGERIKTLSPAQYEQVRDRHITWRRQRGRFERGIAALTEDYRRHLAWLTHPLLALEGHYERGDGAELSVEIDLRAPAEAPALVALGRAGNLQWLPPRPELPPNTLLADTGAAAPQLSSRFSEGALRLAPNFIGVPRSPILGCTFTLRWSEAVLHLDTQGACGADFAGDYLLQPPAHPWPRHPRGNALPTSAPRL